MPARIYKNLFVMVLIALISIKTKAQEIEWLKAINGARSKTGDVIMNGFTNSVYPVSAIVPLGQLIYGYKQHDEKTIANAWETVGGIGLNAVLTLGLKYGINRERPYNTYTYINPYQHLNDPSFPSGHTSYSFCVATSLSIEYPKWYIVLPSYLWAGTVGYSRMYLGMHYPSDVLGGAIVGAGSSWLSYKGSRWLRDRSNKKVSAKIE